MKKISIAFCLTFAFITSTVNAQDFRIGVKGAFNSTWLFNNNVSDKGDEIDYASTFSPSFGLSTILYFTENVGVSLDLLYATNAQKYTGKILGVTYDASASVKYLDIPVLFRLSSEGGPYVEIGPQIGLLMGETDEFKVSSLSIDSTKDFKNDFNSMNLAAVLGFGYDIQANDNLFINVGLRFGYGINDVTKEYSQTEMGATDHSLASSEAHVDATGNFNYHKTNRAFGGLMVGLIFKPGK